MPADVLDLRLVALALVLVAGCSAVVARPARFGPARGPVAVATCALLVALAVAVGAVLAPFGVPGAQPLDTAPRLRSTGLTARVEGRSVRVRSGTWPSGARVEVFVCRRRQVPSAAPEFPVLERWFDRHCGLGARTGQADADGRLALRVPLVPGGVADGGPCDRPGSCVVLALEPARIAKGRLVPVSS